MQSNATTKRNAPWIRSRLNPRPRCATVVQNKPFTMRTRQGRYSSSLNTLRNPYEVETAAKSESAQVDLKMLIDLAKKKDVLRKVIKGAIGEF